MRTELSRNIVPYQGAFPHKNLLPWHTGIFRKFFRIRQLALKKVDTFFVNMIPDTSWRIFDIRRFLTSKEQDAGAVQINRAIRQLDQVTQQNSTT